MKNVIYILSFIACLFISCDKEDDWSENLGNNPLEGTWIREGVSQKILATFEVDHTSYIHTYHMETGDLENLYQQGKYRVVGDSLLIYQNGYKNLYKLSEDGNAVEIIYGYGNNNPGVEKKYRYLRYIEVPEPEPEESMLQIVDIEAAKEVLANLKVNSLVSIEMSNWNNVELVKVSLRKKLTIEELEMADYKLEEGALNFTVPETTPSGFYSLIVVYITNGQEKEVMFDAVECVVKEEETPPEPESTVLVFKNQVLGASRHSDIGCLLTINENQIDVQTACYLIEDGALTAEENQKRRAGIDIIGNTYSGPAFAFVNSKKIALNLKNYYCNGKGLPNAATVEDQEMYYRGYSSILTKFAVLQEGSQFDTPIIELIKTNNLKDISESATPDLFNGNIQISRESVQSAKEGESVSSSLFTKGSVVAFRSSKNGKVGLMLIREINNLDGNNDAADATVVFDLYYQK